MPMQHNTLTLDNNEYEYFKYDTPINIMINAPN